jgi:hypothetical protein
MEYESPVREGATGYTIPVRTVKNLEATYSSAVSGSHTTPPQDSFAFTAYIADMAALYEAYSKKWFNREMLSIFFIKNVSHKWDHRTHRPYVSPPRYESVPIQVHQIWCPVSIAVHMNKFTIHWKLLNSKYSEHAAENVPSGEIPVKKSEEVPYGQNQVVMVLNRTSRSEYERRIRRARILLTASRVRLRTLLLAYTEKYGELDATSDKDSILSFGSED